MAALSVIFWIIVGVVVIGYNGFKEASATTFAVILTIGLFIAPCIVLSGVNGDSEVSSIVVLWIVIEYIVAVALICRLADSSAKKKFAPWKERKINEYVDKRLANLQQEFANAGYRVDNAIVVPPLNDKRLFETFEETTNPMLRGSRKQKGHNVSFCPSILYNREEDRPATIKEIYKEISEIQLNAFLLVCSERDLGKIAGVDIGDLPLDNNISKRDLENIRIREIKESAKNEEVFQRSLSKEYSKSIGGKYSLMDLWCNDKTTKREVQKSRAYKLLLRYILLKQGWDVSDINISYMSPEYIKEFNDYMMTHGSAKLNTNVTKF